VMSKRRAYAECAYMRCKRPATTRCEQCERVVCNDHDQTPLHPGFCPTCKPGRPGRNERNRRR
jgi:hypothetical protein